MDTRLDWMRSDWEFWLSETPGFTLRAGSRRLGVVEYVRYSSSHERPDTLHVRSGVLRLRRSEIRVEEVEMIDPVARTVWLSDSERVLGGDAARESAPTRFGSPRTV